MPALSCGTADGVCTTAQMAMVHAVCRLHSRVVCAEEAIA